MRLTSASHHLSFLVSISVSASSRRPRAASNWPSSARALANDDNQNGPYNVDPVDRQAKSPDAIISAPSAHFSSQGSYLTLKQPATSLPKRHFLFNRQGDKFVG